MGNTDNKFVGFLKKTGNKAGKGLKNFSVNLLKFLIIFIGACALLYVISLLPDNVIAGTTLPVFLSAVTIVCAMLTCTAVTGKMFGSALMSFVLPFISYFLNPLFSPVFIAVHIFSDFMMIFLYNLIRFKKENYLTLAIPIVIGGLARYGLLYVFCKAGEKFIEYIMIFKNVTDEQGLADAVTQMRIESQHGQLIATVLGVVAAYGFIALFKLVQSKKK